MRDLPITAPWCSCRSSNQRSIENLSRYLCRHSRDLSLNEERLAVLHELRLLELRHNYELCLAEVRHAHENDKQKIVTEVRRLLTEDVRKIVGEVKRKQWVSARRKDGRSSEVS